MNSKVIISGCSYSFLPNGSYGTQLKNIYGYDVENISYYGQSNDSILKKIYDFIKKNEVSDSLIICQLTYLHRIGWYHHINSLWMDYQPNFINKSPHYKNEKLYFDYDKSESKLTHYSEYGEMTNDDFDKLKRMYNTWLNMVYDDDATFDYLLYKIDTLQSYIEKTKNKILFIYWPEIQNQYQLSEIQNRNFLNINGEYSILNWSVKNNMIGNDSHLSTIGSIKFSDILHLELKKYTSVKLSKKII